MKLPDEVTYQFTQNNFKSVTSYIIHSEITALAAKNTPQIGLISTDTKML
jgi:hypothetical protein